MLFLRGECVEPPPVTLWVLPGKGCQALIVACGATCKTAAWGRRERRRGTRRQKVSDTTLVEMKRISIPSLSASQSLLQRLSLLHTLDSHRGCVNSVVWNDGGSLLLSGSDDHRLVVTEPHTKRVVADVETAHRANIFSAKFLPGSGDSKIVSCAGDGTLLYTGEKCLESIIVSREKTLSYIFPRFEPPGRYAPLLVLLSLRDLLRDPDHAGVCRRRPAHLPLLRRGRHRQVVRLKNKAALRVQKKQRRRRRRRRPRRGLSRRRLGLGVQPGDLHIAPPAPSLLPGGGVFGLCRQDIRPQDAVAVLLAGRTTLRRGSQGEDPRGARGKVEEKHVGRF